MTDWSPITIWACCWSGLPHPLKQIVSVMKYCGAVMPGARRILFAPRPVKVAGVEWYRVVNINNMDEWNLFVNYFVPLFIRSPFAMSVHGDGFPTDFDQWDDRFLEYDYIGAPWADHVVGNGGFNLESEKLLREKLDLPMNGSGLIASDYWVCRHHRRDLERSGIRFAPFELALKFSTETVGQNVPSFGFHGREPVSRKYNRAWQILENFQ